MRWVLIGALLWMAGGVAQANLDTVRAEPNLEKRSKLAMDNATAALRAAREAYSKGDLDLTASKITEMRESVEMAYESLEQTGKNPRKSPRWFKRAEIDSRDLLRSIETFLHDMSYTDRPMLESARDKVQEVHQELLNGVMGGKRK